MAGVSSRRAADEAIADGFVKVNGQTVTELGIKIDPQADTVTVNDRTITVTQKIVYILLNKPKDYITTSNDEHGRRTVLDLVSVRERIYPVGRLDRQTTGALLLTNDGELANKLMHPSSGVIKSYHVSLNKSLDKLHAEKLIRGVYLDDGKTDQAELDIIPGTKSKEVVLHIHEGRNRQVRRMFEFFGYDVEKLHRVSYAGLSLHGIGRGRWRFLTLKEIRQLQSAVSGPAVKEG